MKYNELQKENKTLQRINDELVKINKELEEKVLEITKINMEKESEIQELKEQCRCLEKILGREKDPLSILIDLARGFY
jgi:predicted RNase H-like nuclease (RuvC/YqgF family)